jgi:hypothetical protein
MNIFKSLLNKTQFAEKDFQKIMQGRARYLTILSQIVVERSLNLERINRPLLGQLFIEAAGVEEFLDSADALANRYWYSFRRSVAVLKIISQVCYKLLHIHDSLPRYHLLKVEGEFEKETELCIKQMRELLISGCSTFVNEGKKRDITAIVDNIPEFIDEDISFSYHLPATRRVRHESAPGATVVALATEFLNLSEANRILECMTVEVGKKDCLQNIVPDPLSAENVRILETRFHNMQSLYDTFVSGSDLPQQDKNLPVMRGHISVIFHILEVLTAIIHYYQRHVNGGSAHSGVLALFENRDDHVLMDLVVYCLVYADRYRKASRSLCQDMLRHYAEMGSITVSAPNYRGFHVRPATLIAKIVLHYGSEVKMRLYDQEYNTALPLELFRANEELNARKRKHVFELIAQTRIFKSVEKYKEFSFEELKHFARDAFIELAEKKEIVIYDPAFSFSDIEPIEGEDYLAFTKRVVTRYMALGRMDARLDAKVTFEGDKRVLEDISILAEHGYGEDLFGNNIVLPKALAYLSR